MGTNENELLGKSIPELEIEDGELQIERARLCQEKQALVGQVVEINARLKNRLATSDYRRLVALRAELVKRITEKDQELADLRITRRRGR
jgi:hypothetical protein